MKTVSEDCVAWTTKVKAGVRVSDGAPKVVTLAAGTEVEEVAPATSLGALSTVFIRTTAGDELEIRQRYLR